MEREEQELQIIARDFNLNFKNLVQLGQHLNCCNIDVGCDYQYCGEAKRVVNRNALSQNNQLSIVHLVQIKRREQPSRLRKLIPKFMTGPIRA
jgi:hypothetical protein